jgi:hypothetical protein
MHRTRDTHTHARTHAERETRARTHAHMHRERQRDRETMMFGGIFRVLGDGRWFCGGWDLGPWLGVVGGWPSICK